MTLDFARTIGDNYDEYTDDELGYNYHASEVISASEATCLQQIRLLDAEEIDELEQRLDAPSDLQRWALARRRLADGDRSRYFEHVQAIIEGNLAHPALHYPEIFVDLAREHAGDGALDAARDIVARIEDQWPDLSEALPLLDAQLLLYAGRPDDAHQAFVDALEDVDDDIDLLIETAEDFIDNDAPQFARQWLNRAEELAGEVGDGASVVDIELLRRQLPESSSPPDEA